MPFNKKVGSWLLLGVWAAALLTGLLIYTAGQAIPFDKDMRLAQAAMSPSFDADLIRELMSRNIPAGSIVHLESSKKCFCNQLTASHQQELAQYLDEIKYHYLTINIDQHPKLKAIIPSFPALAVIGPEGKLRYLGPYATGLGCYTGDDLVEKVAQLAAQPQSDGAVIISDAKGCFCST